MAATEEGRKRLRISQAMKGMRTHILTGVVADLQWRQRAPLLPPLRPTSVSQSTDVSMETKFINTASLNTTIRSVDSIKKVTPIPGITHARVNDVPALLRGEGRSLEAIEQRPPLIETTLKENRLKPQFFDSVLYSTIANQDNSYSTRKSWLELQKKQENRRRLQPMYISEQSNVTVNSPRKRIKFTPLQKSRGILPLGYLPKEHTSMLLNRVDRLIAGPHIKVPKITETGSDTDSLRCDSAPVDWSSLASESVGLGPAGSPRMPSTNMELTGYDADAHMLELEWKVSGIFRSKRSTVSSESKCVRWLEESHFDTYSVE